MDPHITSTKEEPVISDYLASLEARGGADSVIKLHLDANEEDRPASWRGQRLGFVAMVHLALTAIGVVLLTVVLATAGATVSLWGGFRSLRPAVRRRLKSVRTVLVRQRQAA